MTHRITAKKLLKYGGLTLLALVIFGYSLSRASDLLFGIRMNVSGLTNGESVKTSTLALSGNAHNAIGITIDGNPVSIDTEGIWHDTLVLLPGYNSVKVSAADKFGRDVTNEFAIYYNAPEPNLQPPDMAPDTPSTDTTASSPETAPPSAVAASAILSMTKAKVTTD